MGMHTLDDLMRKWQREEVTAEQMVGRTAVRPTQDKWATPNGTSARAL
jgi:hypothetical protein